MKKSMLSCVLLALSVLVTAPMVNAHGSDKPLHGGVVKVEHEMVFELVREEKGVSLYLRDHGEPYPTKDISGDVTVLSQGKKADAQLVSAGDNKMTADVSIPDGAKVLVKVKEGDHHAVTVRFSF